MYLRERRGDGAGDGAGDGDTRQGPEGVKAPREGSCHQLSTAELSWDNGSRDARDSDFWRENRFLVGTLLTCSSLSRLNEAGSYVILSADRI